MKKNQSGGRGAAKTGGMGGGNAEVYDLMHRREMRSTGGAELSTNSHNLDDYIPSDQLERQCITKFDPKKGIVKVEERRANAEELIVGHARRHQMRLATHIRTGASNSREQDGKHPSGSGMVAPWGNPKY
jgi:hypothetical protein